MKVTNNSQALRGVWFGGDLVWIKPGDAHEGDMTADEAKLVERDDLLAIDGKAMPAGQVKPKV